MTTQEENELICEKLLGWVRHTYPANESPAWEVPSKAGEFQPTVFVTPGFETWADAGLILDALRSKGVITSIQFTSAGYCAIGRWCSPCPATENIPSAIRAAALEYTRSES